MNRELYLFIIWHNGRFMEKQIAADLKKKFDIFQIYNVVWKPDNYAANLARFYGKKLPKGYKKEKETGSGAFRAYLVYDKNPQFSKGKNIAIQHCKSNYRHLTGGGNLVHATDNATDTNEDLLFLFGKTTKDFEQEQPNPLPQDYERDVIGSPRWENIEQVLEVVKKLPFTRIKEYKNSYIIHSKNADLVRRILNAKNHFKLPGVHKYTINIGRAKQAIYIRKVS